MPPSLSARPVRRRARWAALLLAALLAAGCPRPGDGTGPPVFNNTTDPTNGGAAYIGASACSACHAGLADVASRHGHAHALSRVLGAAPTFPAEATRAGVPDPPPGRTWNDISYVIGGYLHRARFVGADGFVLTDGTAGAPTQWNLEFAATGTPAGFVPFEPDRTAPLPLDFATFRRVTTGPQPQDPARPLFQDGRPGIRGTWVEPGVQCEACHGPGSAHAADPGARDLFVDPTPATCAGCHLAGDDPAAILAADGYIRGDTQYAELRASGGHADFHCTFCHDPHASTVYDRSRGIRNACTACHAGMTMAGHRGAVFVRGDYVEPVGCESCHMPFAGRSGAAAGPAVVGTGGRMGDVRSHIFRIDTRPVAYPALFSADGRRVRTDAAGRAAVTLDFVCLRCHADEPAAENSAFPLRLEFVSEAAPRLHGFPEQPAGQGP